MKRYWTPRIKELVRALEEEQDSLDVVRRTMLQRLLQRFDSNYNKWLQAISCVAELDALISLARSCSLGNGMNSV